MRLAVTRCFVRHLAIGVVIGLPVLPVCAADGVWPSIEVVSPKTVESTGGCTNPVADQWGSQIPGLSNAMHGNSDTRDTKNESRAIADELRSEQRERSGVPPYLTEDF